MKIGLIGIDSINEENHFLIIKNALQKNLKAIFSPHFEEITPISKSYNLINASSANELFEKVDAVYFANSLKLNYNFALNALKKSCHIFIEDISELEIEEIKQLYKVASEARTKIQLKMTQSFTPEYIEVKDFIKESKLIEINKSFPVLLRQKDFFTEILNDLNFANQNINSTIKKISSLVLPLDNNHYSLVHLYVTYDNGAILNIKFNNIADTKESNVFFHSTDSLIKIDFQNHFSVKHQFISGNINRKEFQIQKEPAFNIEMLHFVNACKSIDTQGISESPTELKIIQATQTILEQIVQVKN